MSSDPQFKQFRQDKKKCSQAVNLLAKATAFLSRREHSSYELKNKLLRYTDDQQAIDNVLQRLQKENWQSDQRFVENFIELKKYKWGNKRIYYELEKHQLDKNLILELQEQLLETEFDRAYQVWERKFANKELKGPQDINKQMRFLAYRGFSQEVIYQVLKEVKVI